MKWHYLVEYLRLLLFATRTVVDIIIRDILFRQNLMKRLRKTRKITNFENNEYSDISSFHRIANNLSCQRITRKVLKVCNEYNFKM